MNMHSRSVELTNTALWLLALLPLCSDHIWKTMSQPWHFAAGDICFVISARKPSGKHLPAWTKTHKSRSVQDISKDYWTVARYFYLNGSSPTYADSKGCGVQKTHTHTHTFSSAWNVASRLATYQLEWRVGWRFKLVQNFWAFTVRDFHQAAHVDMVFAAVRTAAPLACITG